jgi:hypothetical protein
MLECNVDSLYGYVQLTLKPIPFNWGTFPDIPSWLCEMNLILYSKYLVPGTSGKSLNQRMGFKTGWRCAAAFGSKFRYFKRLKVRPACRNACAPASLTLVKQNIIIQQNFRKILYSAELQQNINIQQNTYKQVFSRILLVLVTKGHKYNVKREISQVWPEMWLATEWLLSKTITNSSLILLVLQRTL